MRPSQFTQAIAQPARWPGRDPGLTHPQRTPWHDASQGVFRGVNISNVARDVGPHTGVAVGKCGQPRGQPVGRRSLSIGLSIRLSIRAAPAAVHSRVDHRGPHADTALQPRRRSRRTASRAHQALTQLRAASSPNAFSHSPQTMFSPGLPHRFTPQLQVCSDRLLLLLAPSQPPTPTAAMSTPSSAATLCAPSGRSTVGPKLFCPTCRPAGGAKRSHQKMRKS